MRLRAVLVSIILSVVFAAPIDAGGFDQYGYNYVARVFSGPADGVDRVLDDTVWGDPTYARDHLVMKWSKGWDDARFGGAPWTTAAWLDNEWNGNVPGGSGWTEHFKAVWVGPCSTGAALPDGSYCLWGEFAAIFDRGMDPSHSPWMLAKASPAGYGAYR